MLLAHVLLREGRDRCSASLWRLVEPAYFLRRTPGLWRSDFGLNGASSYKLIAGSGETRYNLQSFPDRPAIFTGAIGFRMTKTATCKWRARQCPSLLRAEARAIDRNLPAHVSLPPA